MKARMRDVLGKAKKEHYAVPAANIIDWNCAKAYSETSEKLGLPLILAFAQVHSQYLSLEDAAAIGRYFQEVTKTPVVLHLDHGQDLNFIKRAIELGFNSVMIDASLDIFEENVRKTKEVVEYAHQLGVDVEAEIGFVGANAAASNEEVKSIYTSVEDAKKFVEETNVDSLAVSIGTSHGLYKGTPKLNFERLEELDEALAVPLVLHGGSGSGDDNLNRCATHGISKINIYSDFIYSGAKAVADGQVENYIDIVKLSREGMENTLEHYYKVFETK